MSGSTRGYADGYFTTLDGLKLHYRDYAGSAEKRPILCLHGLTRNARDFAEFGERHSPGRRVLALDFRGRGLSEYDPQPHRYVPPTYAGDAIALLDHLGVEEAIVVGTSLGGLVAMAIGTFALQRIAGTILNDVGPDLSTAGLDRIRSYLGKDSRFASWDEAAAAIAENNHHLPASHGPADWVGMARRVCREQAGEIVFDYDMAIAVPFDTAGPTPKVDLWPLFAILAQKPLLVVRGEQSDLLSAAAVAKMRAVAPQMQSVTIPGVGHAPMLDEPDAVRAIDSFLASMP